MDLSNRRVGGFVAGPRRGWHGLFRFVGHELFTRCIPTAPGNGFSRPAASLIPRRPSARTGRSYFGSHDKKFYALNPDGTLRWTFATGGQIISSPAIAADGTVYFTSTDGNLYALRPDGTERWRLHTGGIMESSPVLDPAGNLYLSVDQDTISVSPDGTNRWKVTTDDSLKRRQPSPPTARFIFPRLGGG